MSDCEQCKSFYLELERLRRLVPTGTYTLNVAHEEELERMRVALRAAEKRELEALAELDEAKAEVARLRWGEEMSCENTPNSACECPGCETARERAEKGEATP